MVDEANLHRPISGEFRGSIEILSPKVTHEKLLKIRNKILDKADTLATDPYIGQEETYLAHLGLGHRRIIENHYKIIYRVVGDYIYITDIFDSRQDPEKMK